jgi:hypothetical protein
MTLHVMAGLVPAIHVLAPKQDVDAQHKSLSLGPAKRPDPRAGHDELNRLFCCKE